MSIWINKKRKKQYTLLVSTGWTMLVYQLLHAERERGGWTGADMFTASRTCDRVSLTVPLWLFPLCFVLHLACPRKAICSSQNKSIASRRVLLSASMTICLSISRLYVLRRMDWDGSHFLLKIWVSYFPITIYLQNLSTSTLKSNRIIVRRTMAQNNWRGMMQVEGMLDKIGVVHWMSLSNTPILWITLLYLTNCTILSQEICFRGSQCYKCSLMVSGWRHNVSPTSQMDLKFARLFEILWIP